MSFKMSIHLSKNKKFRKAHYNQFVREASILQRQSIKHKTLLFGKDKNKKQTKKENSGFQQKETLSPGGDVAISGDIFGSHDWEGGVTGIQGIEARKVDKHPTMHRTVPYCTQSYLAQNVNTAKVEKSCSKRIKQK